MDDDLGAAGLRFERDGSIGWCIIDRPAARNAFTPAMYFGIKRAVRLVNSDPALAALIITGTGDVFAAGGDLGGRAEPGDRLPETSVTTSCRSSPCGTAARRWSRRSTGSARPAAC